MLYNVMSLSIYYIPLILFVCVCVCVCVCVQSGDTLQYLQLLFYTEKYLGHIKLTKLMIKSSTHLQTICL